MRRELGNLYVYGAVALVALGLVVALVFGVKSYVDGVDAKAYQRGVDATDAAYKARYNEQLQTVITERDRLLADKEAREVQHGIEITAAEDVHAEEVGSINAEHDRVLARLRSERDKARASAASANSGSAATPAGDTGVCPRPDWRALIPDGDRATLVDEAARGNRIIAKLNECRAVLEIERK